MRIGELLVQTGSAFAGPSVDAPAEAPLLAAEARRVLAALQGRAPAPLTASAAPRLAPLTASAAPRPAPVAVRITGLSGSGKSTLLERLARALDGVTVRSRAASATPDLVIAAGIAAALGSAGPMGAARTPKEAADAVRGVLSPRARGAGLVLAIDDVEEIAPDERARGRLASFLVHVGQLLRGRLVAILAGARREGWHGHAAPPELSIVLGIEAVREIAAAGALRKTGEGEAALRALLRASGAADEDGAISTYPFEPEVFELLVRIVTALPRRESGLHELLHALSRDRAGDDLGCLVPLDQCFERLSAALAPAVLEVLADPAIARRPAAARVARAVALLSTLGDERPVTAALVAASLRERMDQRIEPEAAEAELAELVRGGVLVHAPRRGHAVRTAEMTAWEAERQAAPVNDEEIMEVVLDALRALLLASGAPVSAFFSDGKRHHDTRLLRAASEPAAVVDLRLLDLSRCEPGEWIERTGREPLVDRLVWIAGRGEDTERSAAALARSRRMLRIYGAEARGEDAALEARARDAIARAFAAGTIYVRGEATTASGRGDSFTGILHSGLGLLDVPVDVRRAL